MAGPLLTFTNVPVWLFAFITGAFTRDAFQVTGLGSLILIVFWLSDFAYTSVTITSDIELWYNVLLIPLLLLGALAGQEFSRMFQLSRLISFSNPMPYDFGKPDRVKAADASVDWITQLFGIIIVATTLGINFWAGRTFSPPSGLAPIGEDLITPGIIITVICIVLLVFLTIVLIQIGQIPSVISAKYLWLTIPIPLSCLIQVYAQYTWGWNNGWPEFLWYGLLIVAFLITASLAIYVPVKISADAPEALLIDAFYDNDRIENSRAFGWIYFGSLFGAVVVGTLLFNLIAMWQDETPDIGCYVLMGYSGFVILFSAIFGAAMFNTMAALIGWGNRKLKVGINGVYTQIDLRTLA